jgi:hypothetical protein
MLFRQLRRANIGTNMASTAGRQDSVVFGRQSECNLLKSIGFGPHFMYFSAKTDCNLLYIPA